MNKNSQVCECIEKLDYGIGGKKCLNMIDNYSKNRDILNLIYDNFRLLLKKNTVIRLNNLKIVVSEINEKKNYLWENKNLTKTNFTKCEKILREKYMIDDNRKLYVAKIDITPLNGHSIVDYVEYEIFNDQGEILDLTPCKEVTLKIIYPITDPILVNLETAKQLLEQNIDIYNYSSSFYSDYCIYYQVNGSDIPVKQRRKKFLLDVNLCENNCEFEEINIYDEYLICNCKVKTRAEINNNKIYFDKHNYHFEKALDLFFNWRVFTCYNLFYDLSQNYMKNLGFWIGGTLIICNLICVLISYTNGFTVLKSKIYKNYAGNPPYKKKDTLKKYRITLNHDSKNSSDREIVSKNKNITKDSKINIIEELNKFKENKQGINFFSHNLENQTEEEDLIHSKFFQLEKYGGITFEQAKKKPKKFFLISLFSIFISKLDLVTLFFFREKYDILPFLLSAYFFDILLGFTLNCIIYNDDIVSESFENQGNLSFTTSIALSLLANLFNYLINKYLSNLIDYNESLEILTNEVKDEKKYKIYSSEIIPIINLRTISYFILQFILSCGCLYYIIIFCFIYQTNQINIIKNYIVDVVEDFLIPLILSTIICLLRYYS